MSDQHPAYYLRMHCNSSLVPRLPNLLKVTREKRRSLVKLITCVASGGTNFHIWHNSKLAGSRCRISHKKFKFFDLNITISYESASGGHSVPSLWVENYNLHSNSIVHSSKSGVDTIELPCKSQFSTHSEAVIASSLAHS